MSRNFELLQNLGREREMFEASVAEAHADTAVVEPVLSVAPAPVPVEPQPLQLQMDESQRDEIFKLVQRVFLMPGASKGRLVVVSGMEAGNGCSWICARMAEVLASQVSGSVCVVDANLRSPGLHREFEVQNHYGLTDALQVNEPVRRFVTSLSRPNLWLLSCGAETESMQSMLSSDRMRALLPELQREFDYVLIDAPPIESGDESVVLGRSAEGIVLVLRANSSRRETARKAVQNLEGASVKVLGAVLNRRTFPVPESIYRKL
ncbi:MAG TPA: CpsD/CapB family tyrosine-protein kinase [Candidatus Sulfotelmatobacter sp.]|jgi:capsular exopolysaccharide synthesis family protein|nr:CpsD/CapB family tyrosine-protein kinase [Candidatus Sulfotelmatobacter sp.]